MSNTWVIADTHFRHQSLLDFRGRDGNLVRGSLFDNIDQHDEYMIDQWNSVVKSGDTVYHLGDVVVGGTAAREWFETNWSRLNGTKHLIVGNHDDIKYLAGGDFFETVNMWKMFANLGLLLTHAPMHKDTSAMWGSKDVGLRPKPIYLLNVHGHIHENPSPEGMYRCVCVEHVNYTPVNIEELRIF